MVELTGIVAVAPLGSQERSFMPRLLPRIERVIEREVVAAPILPLSRQAFDGKRRQWSAARLLHEVASQRHRGWERLVGLTDADLFIPELTFVFGLANARLGAAIVSTSRLAGPHLLELTATECIHELGHSYGLSHCNQRRCAMRFSRTLADSLDKGEHFCAEHQAQLRRTFSQMSPRRRPRRAGSAANPPP